MVVKKKKILDFYKGIGKRKTAVAEVRILPKEKKKKILVNGKLMSSYFPDEEFKKIITSPLKITDYLNKFSVSVKVKGGGFRAQAEAIRLGLSKALINLDKNSKKILKKAGFLTRDIRIRERKKFGLRRARRARQWRKR